jgi:hypothetical protein
MRSDEQAAHLSLEEDRIEDLEPEDGKLAEGVKGGSDETNAQVDIAMTDDKHDQEGAEEEIEDFEAPATAADQVVGGRGGASGTAACGVRFDPDEGGEFKAL